MQNTKNNIQKPKNTTVVYSNAHLWEQNEKQSFYVQLTNS